MPDSQPGRFLFLAHKSACHPSSLPPSLHFLWSPRKTRPRRSSGMVSSTNPSVAASCIKRAFLCSRLSKWKRARELKLLFLLWPCGCLEVLPGLPESRREKEQHVGSPQEGDTQPWPPRPCSPIPVLCCHPAAAPHSGDYRFSMELLQWKSFFTYCRCCENRALLHLSHGKYMKGSKADA